MDIKQELENLGYLEKDIESNLNKDPNNALILASQKGDIPLVQKLLQIIPVNYQDDNQFTALTMAPNIKMIDFLLKKGANINNRDVSGRTILHSAVVADDLDLFRYLIKMGADIHMKDFLGRTVYSFEPEPMEPNQYSFIRSTEMLNLIKEYLKKQTRNPDLAVTIPDSKYQELELRFGKFFGKRFDSNVDIKTFFRLVDYFSTSKNYKVYTDSMTAETIKKSRQFGWQYKPISRYPVYTVTNYYTDVPTKLGPIELREIFVTYSMENSDLSDNIIKENVPIFYESKENVEQLDFPEYNMRFNKALEHSFPIKYPGEETQVQLGTKTMKRIKKRWSNYAIDGPLQPFRIDLTMVKSYPENGYEKTSYEVELELINKEGVTYKKDFVPAIKYMLSLIQDSDIPISVSGMNDVIKTYNQLFHEDITEEKKRKPSKQKYDNRYKFDLYNPLIKPINFVSKVFTETNDYTVTDKADGQRKMLYVRDDGMYLLYPPVSISKFSSKGNDYQESIFDGELINIDGTKKFLIFDVLFFKKSDMRKLPFKQRLSIINNLNFRENVVTKVFYTPPKNFFVRNNTILDLIPDKEYENDGLIFNNLNEDYSRNAKIYKWKPKELLTIDFKLKKVTVKSAKELNLDYQPDAFTLNVFSNHKLTRFSEYPKIYIDSEASDGQVIEFYWNYNTEEFEFLRERNDRENPNTYYTAKSIWNDIQKPITIDSIRGLDLVAMRKIHNKDKLNMLSNNCNGTLLDIGSGKGGDILKWKNLSLNVYAIEPNNTNISELKNRLTTFNYHEKNGIYTQENSTIKTLQTGGEDTFNISDLVKDPVECVSIFNALTFFFKNEQMLDQLMNTISVSTDVNSRFIGMVMDSEKVIELLNGKDSVDYPGWQLNKVSFNDTPYNNEITINLEDTIVTNQTEYLVDYTELSNKLKEIGFTQLETGFLDYPELSESQNILSRTYRYFVFERVEKTDVVDFTGVSLQYPILEVEEKQDSRVGVPKDLQLLHALLRSGKKIIKIDDYLESDENRREYLAKKLDKYIHKKIEKYYSSKYFNKIRKSVPEYSYESVSWQNWNNQGLFEFIARILKINIEIQEAIGLYNVNVTQKGFFANTIKIFIHDGFYDSIYETSFMIELVNKLPSGNFYFRDLPKETQDSLKSFFPRTSNFGNIMSNKQGIFSVTTPSQAKQILSDININTRDYSLVDMTAGTGGFPINWKNNFKSFTAFEIDPNNFGTLQNNVDAFGIKNITLNNSDVTESLTKELYKDAVVIVDPEWGGLRYKDTKSIDLFLGDHNLIDIIKKIKKWTKLIMIKVPNNYNFKDLENKIGKITIKPIKKFTMIYI